MRLLRVALKLYSSTGESRRVRVGKASAEATNAESDSRVAEAQFRALQTIVAGSLELDVADVWPPTADNSEDEGARRAVLLVRLLELAEKQIHKHALITTDPKQVEHDSLGIRPEIVAEMLRTLALERERSQAISDSLELVWSGERAVTGARHTSVVIQQLFEQAQQSVLIASYVLAKDEMASRLFGRLAARMDRNLLWTSACSQTSPATTMIGETSGRSFAALPKSCDLRFGRVSECRGSSTIRARSNLDPSAPACTPSA